jgi:hypothetical protein
LYDAPYQQIAAYARIDEAELARGLLESEGIQVALLDGQIASMVFGPAGGSVRVLVPAWDAGRASAILAHPPRLDQPDDPVTPVPRPLGSQWITATPQPLDARIAIGAAVVLAVGLLTVLFR